jgi:hypothetical protein
MRNDARKFEKAIKKYGKRPIPTMGQIRKYT